MIFWQYSKILADSFGFGKGNYGYVTQKYNQLKSGEIDWQSSVKRFVQESDDPTRCAYCGKKAALTHELMLPKSRGGPDTEDNTVMACNECRQNKGDKRLYEWYGIESRDILPRLAESKYLRLLHQLHEKKGTLNESNVPKLCLRCDMAPLCPEKETLTVYCLEGCFLRG